MKDRIKQVMASVLRTDISAIDENTSPETIEMWDSINHMNLILALEEEFGVEFENEEIVNMLNYKLIYLTLNEKLNLKNILITELVIQ